MTVYLCKSRWGQGEREMFDYCSFTAFVSGYVFEQMSLLIAGNNLSAKHSTQGYEEYRRGIGVVQPLSKQKGPGLTLGIS